MWKLTITQKRKPEYSNYKDKLQVMFVSNTSAELLAIASSLMACETYDETSFSIEKVKEEEKEGEE